ncbi:MAG: hypothetical protein PHP98_11090 [Kiritimatiellae bacterium]|nr:hypothetical protein [Kiritimatiellia bacterium]
MTKEIFTPARQPEKDGAGNQSCRPDGRTAGQCCSGLPPNLKDKTWPISPYTDPRFKGEGIKKFLQLRAGYEKSAFVSEGHVQVRRLGPSSFTKPIPAGECAITALVRGQSGKIYGGTSGKRAHMFFYDPSPDADVAVDIGVVGENMRITGLVADERIYGTAEGGGKGVLFSYSPCEALLKELDTSGKGVREIFDLPVEDQMFHSIVDPCHSSGKIEILAELPEGAASLVIDKRRKTIYGLASRNGLFFSYSPASKSLEAKGRVDPLGEFSPKLFIDGGTGTVYGAAGCGRIFKYEPDTGRVEDTPFALPSLKGREAYNRVDAWTQDGQSGLIYGGTIDGILFAFDPRAGDIRCLGKPIDQMRVRALAVGNDGRVFGVGGEPGKCCHLFVYEPERHELRDLGVLLATMETPWYGYEIDCAVTGRDGEIYFGESDRISNLFIYYPPIARRAPAS